MAELVGGIYYEVDLDTRKVIDANRRIGRDLNDTGSKLEGLQTRFTAVAAAAAVLGAALLAMKVAQRADEFRLLSARVDVAAGSLESGSAAFADLVEISRRTQSSLAGNIEVFTRLNQSLLQMGGTQRDTLQLTELLAKAIKVSGASAVEGKAAMLQFGQALGSGKLAGDELRSLLETAPYLMRQLADGIGVPVGALKTLGEQGKLTADVVVNALTKASAIIDADFKKFPHTIEAAMVVAADAAGLAALKLDELSGGSQALTGVIKGTGEVIEELGKQFGAANDEAGKLGRNEAVRSWADAARNALSYLVDAADLTWQTLSVLGRNVGFTFTQMGADVKASAQAFVAMQKWEFGQAQGIMDQRAAAAAKARKELDAADAKTLGRTKLAGQQMREAWEQGAGGGRGSIIPGGAPGKLKGGGGGGDGKKKGAGFDGAAYLAGLSREVADEYARVDVVEREAMRKNDQLLAQKKISAAEHQQAITLIEKNATQDRAEIARKQSEEATARQIEYGAAEEANATKAAEGRKRALENAAGINAAGDPIAQAQLAHALEMEQLNAHLQAGLLLRHEYDEARVNLEAETAQRISDIHAKEMAEREAKEAASANMQLAMAGGVAGQLLDLLQRAGKERTGLAKAAFLAERAIAAATIIINTEVAAAKAGAQLGIFGIPMATMIRATGYASAGMVAGMAIGQVAGNRQYGGPVSSGSLYRVNETGRPEMFTGSNGSQYMMPTKSGSVTPADQVRGVTKTEVHVHNYEGAKVRQQESSDGSRLDVFIGEAARQITENRGALWNALRGSTDIGPRQ